MPALLSEPTTVFQLASFFDPDAPAAAHPHRPADRHHALGAREVRQEHRVRDVGRPLAADRWAGQAEPRRPRALRLPWRSQALNVDTNRARRHDLLAVDPIITICALVLLIIIVKLLDLVFAWMRFFRICFPLPASKPRPEAMAPECARCA